MDGLFSYRNIYIVMYLPLSYPPNQPPYFLVASCIISWLSYVQTSMFVVLSGQLTAVLSFTSIEFQMQKSKQKLMYIADRAQIECLQR